MRKSGVNRGHLMTLGICGALVAFSTSALAQAPNPYYPIRPDVPMQFNGRCAGEYAALGLSSGVLNIRLGPGTNYSVIGNLVPNQVIHVMDCQGEWLGVQNRRNGEQIGWVHARYMRRV
ncbi:hypothetical protein GCM10007094_14140 [Pseudovibrio japonicus]|uniref:SH3b domain-containing protein n=2 Tax=Pseudovibrio japonicus TaxID=366534 RepID=A0ABQ3EBB4_9HYPH|nr:hypothetical protein GCM10007094_14140 [Pseudovibrio japonicus]